MALQKRRELAVAAIGCRSALGVNESGLAEILYGEAHSIKRVMGR
jgi:hypothetical protein